MSRLYRFKKNEYAYGYTEEQIFDSIEEKKRVESLTEVEKEKYLSDKIEKLNHQKEREELLKPSNTNNTNNYNNTSSNSKQKYQSSSHAVNNLKEDLHYKEKENYEVSEEGELTNNEGDWDSELENRKNKNNYHSNNRKDSISSNSELSFSDDENNNKTSIINKNKLNINNDNNNTLTINDIEKMKITRNFVEKYYEFPVFDENVKDLFVKININNVDSKHNNSVHTRDNNPNTGYKLFQIKSVQKKQNETYMFNNKPCDKYLEVSPNYSNNNTQKLFSYNFISNSAINENEYNIWKSFLNNKNITFPNKNDIKAQIDKMNTIKNFTYEYEQLEDIVNKTIEDKIKHMDKNINITLELDALKEMKKSAEDMLLTEKNKEKIKEYQNTINKIIPEIESLKKMKEERENIEIKKNENDLVNIINKKNLERQREDDFEFSLLNKKRKIDDKNYKYNPYKRKHCLPMNLFDQGYMGLNKNEDNKEDNGKQDNNKQDGKDKDNQNDQIDEKKKQNGEEIKRKKIPEGVIMFQKMNKIKNKILEFGNHIDEVLNKDKYTRNNNDNRYNKNNIENNNSMEIDTTNENKNKNEVDNNIDLELFFKLATINKDNLLKCINEQNDKLKKIPNAKIITLDQYN